MAAEVMYLDNDHVPRVPALKDVDGTAVNDAVVTATLYSAAGVPLMDPLTLAYVDGSSGRYEATLDKDVVALTLNASYQMKFVAVSGGVSDGVWWVDIVARKRVI
jgi:hypothetical protein